MSEVRCTRGQREQCGERHCRCCGVSHLDASTPQTCVACQGMTARRIRGIVEYAAELPAQAIYSAGKDVHGELAIPGGDAQVMLVDGSNHVTGLRARTKLGERPDPGPSPYSYPSDPNPPIGVLGTWENDFRHVLHLPAAGPATFASTSAFLLDNLPWAAQHHPAFDEFAAEIRAAFTALENVIHEGLRDEVGVRCIRCDEAPKLRAYYVEPDYEWRVFDVNFGQIGTAASDQGGRRDWWVCPNCHEIYTPDEYLLATGDELRREEATR